MSGTVTGVLALAIALAAGTVWFRRALAVNLPKDRTGFVVAMVGAVALGIAAFVQGAGWIGGVPAGVAILIGAFFLLTVAVGDQKGGSGRFHLGQPVPNFTAPADDGTPFELASLTGNPLLLKFFRGHW
jgi:hypothetical protein